MVDKRREAEIEWQPKPEDISNRAYEIYVDSGRVEGHDIEHWIIAEEELRQEHGKRREPISEKTTTAGAGGKTKA